MAHATRPNDWTTPTLGEVIGERGSVLARHITRRLVDSSEMLEAKNQADLRGMPVDEFLKLVDAIDAGRDIEAKDRRLMLNLAMAALANSVSKMLGPIACNTAPPQ